MMNAKRARAVVALVFGLVVVANGCDGGHEGDRCNPSNSSNECGAGLSCVQPSTCVESYCCPSNASSSTNAFCNGTGCPPPDAGAAEGGGDSGGDGSDAASGTDGGVE